MKRMVMNATDEQLLSMASGLALQLIQECERRTLPPETPWIVAALAAKIAEDGFNYAGSSPDVDQVKHATAHTAAVSRIQRLLEMNARKSSTVSSETDAVFGIERSKPQ